MPPLQTIGRWLGLTQDPLDPPFARKGLARVGSGWQGVMHGETVRVDRTTAVPLVHEHHGLRLVVACPIALDLRAPGEGDPTRDRRFDDAFGVPKAHHGRLTSTVRDLLVRLARVGSVTVQGGEVVLHRRGKEPRPTKVLDWASRLARVAAELRADRDALSELMHLRQSDPDEAVALARRLRGRNRRISNDLRAHADALVRRGRKLTRIVKGPDVAPSARCWAAQRLLPRYVDDVVDDLLDRPRVPGDLHVLAVLAGHHEVAVLLTNHDAFWATELARTDPDHVEALADLVEALVMTEPGPWVDPLVRPLPGLADPLRSAALDAVAHHGSRTAMGALAAQLEGALPRSHRPAWRAAVGRLRDRHQGVAGAVSLAEAGGGVSLPDGR
jgi:hypothetical protein